ncbi:MAG: AMP-binding protein, partial [Sphingobium sp.]
MSNHLFDFFRESFTADPDKAFIEAADGSTISYAEIETRTGRLASLLVALGVRPGDRVAVQAEKSVEGLFLYL